MKLTIELVPQTCWYTNVRSNVSVEMWDFIRKKAYSKAKFRCEICSDVGQNQGVKHSVECHEIWHYDDVNKRQILTGLIALCPNCHKTKHVGLAQMKGEEEIVIQQLVKVNGMSRGEAKEYISVSFEVWQKRSRYDWEIDISFIEKYCSKI